MPKKNKQKSGRPSKLDDINYIRFKDLGYIATNKFSLELLELITEMANYKILTITGPPPGGKNEEKKFNENRIQKNKCLKSRKEIEKKQNRLRKQFDIREDKVFLLRDLDDHPRKYRLLNGKMIECDESSDNNLQDKYDNYQGNFFTNSILKVCKELNKETQNIIKQLVKIFIESDKSLKQFQEQFFQLFKTSSSDLEYKEIKQWNELFEVSFDEKLQLMQREIDYFKDKYSLNSDQEESVKKVEKKKIEVLKDQQVNLDQFKNIKRPDRPLQLLTRRIYCLFLQFWNIDDLQL